MEPGFLQISEYAAFNKQRQIFSLRPDEEGEVQLTGDGFFSDHRGNFHGWICRECGLILFDYTNNRAGMGRPMLDVLARTPLWEDGKDYKHGTGHGVGFVLGVHEGPMRIAMCDNQVPLAPGMLISNEPGYYETGEFGVRIENLIMVTEKEETEWGKFYQMETMTLCPYEREAIVKDMLTDDEIIQINAYHERVYNELAPVLDEETRQFLADQTRVI